MARRQGVVRKPAAKKSGKGLTLGKPTYAFSLKGAYPTGKNAAGKPGAEGAKAPVATSPPPGSYDPAIDAQVGGANRGLQDLLSDYIRDFGEPGTALGGRQGQDYAKGLASILLGRQRAATDYTTNVAGLNRNYAQQGASQTQAARAAGVAGGGALAQALAKRSANKQIQQTAIDTGLQRYSQDSNLQEAGLKTNYLRAGEDSSMGLARAQRENAQFGLDATAQKFYQADMEMPGATGAETVVKAANAAKAVKASSVHPKGRGPWIRPGKSSWLSPVKTYKPRW